ncbi:hypothetical protein [Micromonospora echinospora]
MQGARYMGEFKYLPTSVWFQFQCGGLNGEPEAASDVAAQAFLDLVHDHPDWEYINAARSSAVTQVAWPTNATDPTAPPEQTESAP